VTQTTYELNRELLEPLIAFVEQRGRPPEMSELPEAATIKEHLGSLRAAIALVRRVHGEDSWRTAELAARDDLLVYLALAAFGGRPRFGGLPPTFS
jgi:hypothetical protein